MKRFGLFCAIFLFSYSVFMQDTPAMYSYTMNHPSGNRYLADVRGNFPNVASGEVKLEATPLWIAGGLVGGTPVWVVALEDGRVMAVQSMVGGDSISGLSIEIDALEAGSPPAVKFNDMGLPEILRAGDDASVWSHPVVVNADDETLVYVADNGDLVLWRDGEVLDRAELNLQPDARPVISETGLIAVYANGTNERYVHGIMGDDLEAASLAILSVDDGEELDMETQIDLPDDDVFEGITPMWADVDGDGQQDIVTTVSNGQVGAWIRAYNIEGDLIGDSRAIGQGNRWRHQIAAAPFGLEGETQIVDVLTPHIGGMVEFFTLRDGLLSVNNAQLGYTSHPINSRNLDMAVAGDFDGDGMPELVLTDQARETIAAVTNTENGVTEMWRFDLNGRLTSNLAAIAMPDGRVALAAGTSNGILHVWQ